jgi:hypothetical protein
VQQLKHRCNTPAKLVVVKIAIAVGRQPVNAEKGEKKTRRNAKGKK